MRAALLLALFLLVAPTAAAQGTIRVRVTPQPETVTATPGERKDVPLSVAVEFVGTNCQAGAEVAVSLVLGRFPAWAGASIRPQSQRYDYPKETRISTLEILADEETAPDKSEVTYTVEPHVTEPNRTFCPTSPGVDVRTANVTATFRKPGANGPTAGDGNGGGNGTPGFALSAALLAWGLRLAGGRRRPDR